MNSINNNIVSFLGIILFCLLGQVSISAQCGCSNCPDPLPDNTNQDFFVNVSDMGLVDGDMTDDCSTMILEANMWVICKSPLQVLVAIQ